MISDETTRYEFGSPEWIAFMHGMIFERMQRWKEEAPDLAWSICEVFTSPPDHLSAGGAPIAWTCIYDRGELMFAAKESDDVEFKVTVDYRAVVPLGRFDTRGDPDRQQELASMATRLRETGQMKTTGNRSKRDPRVGDLHDLIARVTA
jgi:hypothetical protein